MQLNYLHISQTPVSDISAVRGMPLTRMQLHGCRNLTDLSPLEGARDLTEITIPPGAKNFEFRRHFPKLERIAYSEGTNTGGRPSKTAEEFWKEYDAQKAAVGSANSDKKSR
jgi:hypothetical protein